MPRAETPAVTALPSQSLQGTCTGVRAAFRRVEERGPRGEQLPARALPLPGRFCTVRKRSTKGSIWGAAGQARASWTCVETCLLGLMDTNAFCCYAATSGLKWQSEDAWLRVSPPVR